MQKCQMILKNWFLYQFLKQRNWVLDKWWVLTMTTQPGNESKIRSKISIFSGNH